MRISPEVEIALQVAQSDASRRRHEYVTLEHLLYALLFDDATALVIYGTVFVASASEGQSRVASASLNVGLGRIASVTSSGSGR